MVDAWDQSWVNLGVRLVENLGLKTKIKKISTENSGTSRLNLRSIETVALTSRAIAWSTTVRWQGLCPPPVVAWL